MLDIGRKGKERNGSLKEERGRKEKGKGPLLDIALLHDEHAQERFTISEVAADWHELMISQRFMRPSTVRASEQLDPR